MCAYICIHEHIYIGDSKFEAKNDKVVFHNLLFQYYKFFAVYNIDNSNQ